MLNLKKKEKILIFTPPVPSNELKETTDWISIESTDSYK